MKNNIGLCRICGEIKELTEEHVPPKGAFNDRQVLLTSLRDALGFSGRRYSKSPNGIKRWSLCEKCNNSTGGDYGAAFVEWTRQAHEFLDKIKGGSAFLLPYQIQPLNVIKQIVVMALALLPEDRVAHYEEWRNFVINREQKYLPADIHVYTYFNKEGKRIADMEGAISRIDVNAIEYVHAEIALPPLGYCITSTHEKGLKSLAEYQRLYDITWFSNFDYRQTRDIWLKLPVKETHEAFPLDYRTKDEIAVEQLKNQLIKAGQPVI